MADPKLRLARLARLVVAVSSLSVTLSLVAEAGPSSVLQAGPIVAGAYRAHPTTRSLERHEAGPLAREPRPGALIPLYMSFGILQALDGRSTLTSVNRGYREMNPIVSPAAGSRGLMVATKLVTTTATIAGAETLWRRNRVAAVLALIGINVAYAAVVAHNYRQLAY
jgi:Domain of unknown function (DUF5658)